MSDGAWGLIGVLAGSGLTLLTQWHFERLRQRNLNRNTFSQKYYQIGDNIFKLTNALKQIENFTQLALTTVSVDNEALHEWNTSLSHFSKQCADIWPEFRLDLMRYFHATMNSGLFIAFDSTIYQIMNSYINPLNFDQEIFEAEHAMWMKKENIEALEKAKKLLPILEKENSDLTKKAFRLRL